MSQHVRNVGSLRGFRNGNEGLYAPYDARGTQILHQINGHRFHVVLLAQFVVAGQESFIRHAGAVAQDAAFAAAGFQHQRNAHACAYSHVANQQPLSRPPAAGLISDVAQRRCTCPIAGGQGIHCIQKPGADLVCYGTGFAVHGQCRAQVVHEGIGQADGQQKPQRHHQPKGIEQPVGYAPSEQSAQSQHHQHQRAADQRGFQQKIKQRHASHGCMTPLLRIGWTSLQWL